MSQNIKHRRLFAFFKSKVLNALMIVVFINLLLIGCVQSMLIPVICASLAMLFFTGYTLWLWIKKPQRVIINNWLSNLSSGLTLYYLIIIALEAPNQWWFITPAVFASVVLLISLFGWQDEKFDI